MLVAVDLDEGRGLLVANVFLLLMMSVRGGIEIGKYVLLQYMKWTYLIDMVDETLECSCWG